MEETRNAPATLPEKLVIWQSRLAQSDNAYSDVVARMDRRENLYRGCRELEPLVPGDTKKDGSRKKTSHVRNIIFENIETQISASIPQPKVTPRRKKDEQLAAMIEHMIRNELDRMPFERMNDMAERTVPIQGGVGFLTEWDETKRTHTTAGEVSVTVIHPKQFAPQPGIYTSISDMDWFIVKLPTTKETIRRKYGKSVYNEGEAEPELRGTGDEDISDDAVTQYIGFAVNDDGGIDRYIWVNDVELEDLENYQARRQPVCTQCGRMRPLPGQIIAGRQRMGLTEPDVDVQAQHIAGQMVAVNLADGVMMPAEDAASSEFLAGVHISAGAEPQERYDGGPGPWCGCAEFEVRQQKYEQVFVPMTTSSGVVIPGLHFGSDEQGIPGLQPSLIPYYTPDVYPIIIQRSVSVYGQLLGNSDVDAIEDQQNTINRLEQKIIDRLVKAGTRITLPPKANLRTDPEDSERWYLESPADKQMIDVYDFSGDLQYELAYLAQVYEESRQILGITDSFQGRRDPTATSGVAKQASAAQAAGRMESKRIMKNAAYAELFELIFKHWLAYSDEPRTVSYKDDTGQTVYEEFSRYDFLEKDADGQYYWNDQFLFSTDTSAPLASNRETMWQETRMNLQTGAFGDPTATETLILFWSKMEELHYPGAASTKSFLEERRQRELQQAQMMQQMQFSQMNRQPTAVQPGQAMMSPTIGG